MICLKFYFLVNSYGYVMTVSSPSHTFSWASLTKLLNQYFVHILSLVNDTNFLNQRNEENDRRNYFMINLYESIGDLLLNMINMKYQALFSREYRKIYLNMSPAAVLFGALMVNSSIIAAVVTYLI